MADVNQANVSDEQDVKNAASREDKSNSSQDAKSDAIPYARFKEVNEQLRALREEKEKRESQEKQAAEEKLKKDKKYEELIGQTQAERDALKKERDDLAAYKAAQDERENARRESLLAKIEDKALREIAEKLPSSDDIFAFTERLSEQKGSPFGAKGAAKGGEANPYKQLPNESFSQYEQRVRKLKGFSK